MPAFVLSNLLSKIDYNQVFNYYEDIHINGISFDSRRVKNNSIFIAIRGEKHDGSEYIDEALENGAAAVIAEKTPEPGSSVPWIHVPDSKLALAQAAAEFYGFPSRDMLLMGVTGTSGKTTVTSMLEKIYETAGFSSGLIGTVNVKYKDQGWPAALTTPDALELQRILRLMVDSGVTHAAMEVSSHSLDQKRVDGINFKGAIFTNISSDHLNYHQELNNYVMTKKRLSTLVEKRGFVLSNGEDPFFKDITAPQGVPLFIYGTDPSHDFYISKITSLGQKGSEFELKIQNEELLGKLYPSRARYQFRLCLLGRHNVFNAAAAAAAALITGIPSSIIFQGLADFGGVERRMQLYELGPLRVIDDKAMNPGGIDALFQTMEELDILNSPIIVVYAIRGGRGHRVNEDNGRTLSRWLKLFNIKEFISTSSTGNVEKKDEVQLEEEEAFFRGTGSIGLLPVHFKELPEALNRALKAAEPGAVLLLLGSKGMDEGLNILKKKLKEENLLSGIIYS